MEPNVEPNVEPNTEPHIESEVEPSTEQTTEPVTEPDAPESRAPRRHLWNRLSPAFDRESTICRLVAAWCTYAAVMAFGNGYFGDLTFTQNASTGAMIGIILLFFVAFTTAAVLLPRSWKCDAWFLLASATLCVARWLATVDEGEGSMLFTLAVIGVYTLFLLYFLQRTTYLLNRIHIPDHIATALALGCGVFGGAVIAITTCLRYMTFSSPNFDFGLFCNMFHYMKETGLPLVTSERDVLLSHFVVHLSPIYYLLLPFYAIFPSPLTLQIGQALVVASGVVPTLLLAKHVKLSGRAQVLVCLIYSLYPALSTGCFYDLHENCFLAPLLLWLFYFFEKEKYVLMYLSALLVFMVKEDAAVYVILFAVFIIISRKKYFHGLVLALLGALYFVCALSLLDEWSIHYAEMFVGQTPNPEIAGPMINRFDNLIPEGEGGLLGAVKTALTNPGYLLTQLFSTDGATLESSFFTETSPWAKVVYVLQMLLPVGMIPFVTQKQSRWLLVSPILLNIVTTYKYQYAIGFQYHFGISAFLIYAMIINLPDLRPMTRRGLLSFAAAACCCLYIVTVLPTYTTYTSRWYRYQDYYTAMDDALDTLPEDASLCVSSFLVAHVADRDEVYQTGYHGNAPDVDYVVLQDFEKGNDAWNAYVAQGYIPVPEYDNTPIAVLKKGDAPKG